MTVNLVTFTKKGGRKDFAVARSPMIIGRKPEADLRIPLSDVSRAHCQLTLEGEKVRLRDLGSSNGTFVNDQQVESAELHAGDRLRIGPVQFTIQIDGRPESIAPAAPAASGRAASGDTRTKTAPPPTSAEAPADLEDLEDLDVEGLEELGTQDLSDFDFGELDDDDEGTGGIEEIEEVEEIAEDDLVPDDEPNSK